MRRLAAWRSTLAGLLLLQAGCIPFLYDDRCGPEYRETVASGAIIGAGSSFGVAEVHLNEVRGDSVPRRVQAYLFSGGPTPGPLGGHVTAARLLDASGREVGFAVTPGLGQEIARLTAPRADDATAFEALRREALASHLRLELRTDLPGLEVIVIPLGLQRANGWDRAHCS